MSRDRMRIERDSLGEVEVPAGALYGAQTQRALENFQLSGFRFPRPFLWALGLIKRTAAEVNAELGLLDSARAAAIATVAGEVERGGYDDHFPLDVFQTGSGTSTNMNANEVIAALAARPSGRAVHPNDHVNLGQSSNDVIPSAARASAARELAEDLLPALGHLADSLAGKAAAVGEVVKTGRTHLMDAVPIRLGQEMGAWESQIRDAAERLRRLIPSLCALPLGGTAVGTGLNSHPEFGARVARRMAGETGLPFTAAANPFAAIASQDAAVELSGQLRGAALALLKIANDLRWMNSGPEAGLNEIALPALQPGSSMMPGKVNPVIPEAVAMICTQVTGFDAAIAAAAASGNFQLNVMQPLVAWNLLTAIRLLSNAARSLADRAVVGLTVNEERIRAAVGRNPALVTALARRIGYDRCAAIAREAAATGRSLEEVAREQSGLSAEELRKMLDPARMTQPGFPE